MSLLDYLNNGIKQLDKSRFDLSRDASAMSHSFTPC